MRTDIGAAVALDALFRIPDGHAGNAAAIALYESFGFVPVGTRKQYYQKPAEDAVLMRRKEGKING